MNVSNVTYLLNFIHAEYFSKVSASGKKCLEGVGLSIKCWDFQTEWFVQETQMSYQSRKSGDVGMGSCWQPNFGGWSWIDLGIRGSKWRRTRRRRRDGWGLCTLRWSGLGFGGKYRTELRCKWPWLHWYFRPINGRRGLRCTVRQ